ncbi:LOW QUALITY PROTEIN: leucine-rich repeat-containing protein 37A3-like, partial [Carlito syrichta]|uniref:LOW QUALITY PROTEIN: leucine-rich repeat-containing protein 37A3-like n=1 Tax=Carlito syrichta TaxID=1868482 RepID=A0A3Q0DPU5_CARSF
SPSQLSEPPKEVESSPVQQTVPAQSSATPMVVEPSLTKQVISSSPPESLEDMGPSPILQGGPTQPPEPPKEAEPSPSQQAVPAQPPEPSEEVVAESPVHHEMTVPTPGQGQAQYLTSPSVSVTVQPLDLGLFLSTEPRMKAEPSPTMHETPTQPPEEVVVSTSSYREVTDPTPGQDQAQHPVLLGVTDQPLDLGLTITPEYTTKAEQSTALKVTTAPPLSLVVTHPYPDQIQTEHPNLTQLTVHPLVLQVTVQTQHANLTQVIAQPLDLEFATTPEPTTEVKLSLTMQETPTQPDRGLTGDCSCESIEIVHLSFLQQGNKSVADGK